MFNEFHARYPSAATLAGAERDKARSNLTRFLMT